VAGCYARYSRGVPGRRFVADSRTGCRSKNLFVSGPRTLPGGVPESDPELCFLTGKGRVRAGSPGSEFRRSGCHPSSLTVVRGEIAAKGMSGVRVRLGPET
jgi:hypothetical protein